MDCPFIVEGEEPPIYGFKRVADQIYEKAAGLYDHIIVAKKMKLPKFVEIIDGNYNYFIAVLERFERKRGSKDKIDFYHATICAPDCRDSHELSTYGSEGVFPKMVMDRQTRRPSHRFFRLKIYPMEIVRVFHSRVPRMDRMVSLRKVLMN
jgi:hypothetical protein